MDRKHESKKMCFGWHVRISAVTIMVSLAAGMVTGSVLAARFFESMKIGLDVAANQGGQKWDTN